MTDETQENQTTENGSNIMSMRADDMCDRVARMLAPWSVTMTKLAHAYLNQYPPTKTRPDVMHAVTVQVPLPMYLAMTTASHSVIKLDNEFKLAASADPKVEEVVKEFEDNASSEGGAE